MKKIFKKTFVVFGILTFVLVSGLTSVNNASAAPNVGWNYLEPTGLGKTDPRTMAINILNVMMTFLGLVAVLIILLGGFKWMTAAGSDDKVDEAKKLLGAGIIGLIIIFASYGIAFFVIDQMMGVSGANTI